MVTAPEAAAILGVTRQRIHQLAVERSDFPEAVYVGSIRAWYRAAIVRFRDQWDRTPGRRITGETA